MSDEEEVELFETGEPIVLYLKDGRHYLGEFVGYYDEGIALRVEAKTAYRVLKAEDSKFEQFVQARIKEELGKLFSPKDWLQKARQLENKLNDNVGSLTIEQLKEYVTGQVTALHRNWAREHWSGPIQEEDVRVPYLQENKRSVRTLVMWDKIDEVCSANEMQEEDEMRDLSTMIDSGEFQKLIEGD